MHPFVINSKLNGQTINAGQPNIQIMLPSRQPIKYQSYVPLFSFKKYHYSLVNSIIH